MGRRKTRYLEIPTKLFLAFWDGTATGLSSFEQGLGIHYSRVIEGLQNLQESLQNMGGGMGGRQLVEVHAAKS